MSELTGSCLCGAVHYRVAADPVVTRTCWCRDCQRLAANGTVNMLIPTAALNSTGEVSGYAKTADSGNIITRKFCPQCGSHLFANSSARPQFTVVRVGTLDNPSAVRPAMNIWASSAPEWACLDETMERVEQQPVPPAPKPAA